MRNVRNKSYAYTFIESSLVTYAIFFLKSGHLLSLIFT